MQREHFFDTASQTETFRSSTFERRWWQMLAARAELNGHGVDEFLYNCVDRDATPARQRPLPSIEVFYRTLDEVQRLIRKNFRYHDSYGNHPDGWRWEGIREMSLEFQIFFRDHGDFTQTDIESSYRVAIIAAAEREQGLRVSKNYTNIIEKTA